MYFVILDSPQFFSHKELASLIYGIGGVLQSEVSKKTNYVIVSEEKQNKYQAMKRSDAYLYVNLLQAKGYPIKVITETECLTFICSEIQAKLAVLKEN